MTGPFRRASASEYLKTVPPNAAGVVKSGARSPMSSAARAGHESVRQTSVHATKRIMTASSQCLRVILCRLTAPCRSAWQRQMASWLVAQHGACLRPRGPMPRLAEGLSALALAGGGALPPRADLALSTASRPSPESPLVRIAQASIPAPELSGFRVMPLGSYSLDARIELIRRAKYSLDIQYYLIQNDKTGHLLLRNVRDAAMRGVRVRLLVDDLYTFGGDPMFIGLSAFPNIYARLVS